MLSAPFAGAKDVRHNVRILEEKEPVYPLPFQWFCAPSWPLRMFAVVSPLNPTISPEHGVSLIISYLARPSMRCLRRLQPSMRSKGEHSGS